MKGHEKLKTREKQYSRCVKTLEQTGLAILGLMSSDSWIQDPKRLFFTLSRYKFVSKMFDGLKNVAEVGCSDGFASRIVAQNVGRLTVFDFDPIFVEEARKQSKPPFAFEAEYHDMLACPLPHAPYDGIYALDVLEHIQPDKENLFLYHLTASLAKHGTCILGMPSINSQQYASPISLAGHVNCKSQKDFCALMQKYFYNVFMFSMNDEVVHTGFHQMSNYFLALAATPREL